MNNYELYIYGITIYVIAIARTRVEEGKRGIADPLPCQRSTSPWLRHRTANRAALAWRAALPCCLALPVAVPAGKAWLVGGPMGREGRPAKTALLPPDRAGPESACRAAAGLASFCGGGGSNYWSGTWLTRYLEHLLFQVKPIDPPIFAIVAVSLLAIALVARYVPARRATRADPITALRCE